jgi:hypothetical protein
MCDSAEVGARHCCITIIGVGSLLTALGCGSDDAETTFSGGVKEPTDAALSVTPETGFIRLEGSVDPAADVSAGDSGGPVDARSSGRDASKLPGDDCPPAPPSMASNCTQVISCTYDACDTTGTTTARCDGQHWALTTQPCAAFPCPASTGRTMCSPGQICMVIQVGDITAWSCDKSACGTGPINCRCGAYGGFATCAGPCVSFEGHQVNCTSN